MVLKWGLPMVAVRPEDYKVTTITGEDIRVVGKSAITIHTADKDEYHLRFLVAENTGIKEIIVGWGDLRSMNLFPLSHTTFLGSASQGDISTFGSPTSQSLRGTATINLPERTLNLEFKLLCKFPPHSDLSPAIKFWTPYWLILADILY